MLLWEFSFILLLILCFWGFIFSSFNIFSLLFTSELIIMLVFCLLLNSAVYLNLNILFGLSYLFLILGGLELSLSILILLI